MEKSVENVNNFWRESFQEKKTLGIFAKEPCPGQVKTRLCPPLTADEAAALYRTALQETVHRLRAGPWQTILFYTGRREFFADAFPGLLLIAQKGADLGERMANALALLLKEGSQNAVLAGSDCPDLPLSLLSRAFVQLEHHEAVVAPARDGGYVLIGQSVLRPELFNGVSWSTDQVLVQTRRQARSAKISLAEIETWEDFDNLGSLRRLIDRSPHCVTAMQGRDLLHRKKLDGAIQSMEKNSP